MKQIVMVTDGKPTACFLEGAQATATAAGKRSGRAAAAYGSGELRGGRRLYKNSMGNDPVVMDATFREVQACRKAGVMINTFMLASDYYLVEFVKEMSAMTHGKAYFATPGNLTQFVLIDFLKRKKSRVR
jgi:Ca-activated chloride channel family protein